MHVSRRPPLNLEEAAAYTNLTARFLRREVQRGRLAVVRLGRLLRFDPDDLDDYLRRCRVAPTAADLAGERLPDAPEDGGTSAGEQVQA